MLVSASSALRHRSSASKLYSDRLTSTSNSRLRSKDSTSPVMPCTSVCKRSRSAVSRCTVCAFSTVPHRIPSTAIRQDLHWLALFASCPFRSVPCATWTDEGRPRRAWSLSGHPLVGDERTRQLCPEEESSCTFSHLHAIRFTLNVGGESKGHIPQIIRLNTEVSHGLRHRFLRGRFS